MTWLVWSIIGLSNLSLLGTIAMNISLVKERVHPEYLKIAGQLFLFLVICWFMLDTIPA